MVYTIVLKDGQELECCADNADEVVEMQLDHSIFVVKENKTPDHVTYILREDVSHLRLPKTGKNVAQPIS